MQVPVTAHLSRVEPVDVHQRLGHADRGRVHQRACPAAGPVSSGGSRLAERSRSPHVRSPSNEEGATPRPPPPGEASEPSRQRAGRRAVLENLPGENLDGR
jgi:hypothetical protein